MVSGVRSLAAARLPGPAWARGGSAARGSAHGPRGALRPARPRSLQSTARSSRAAVPEAGRSWRPQAGWRECHFLTWSPRDFSRAPAGSPSVFPRSGGRASSLLSAFAETPRRGRERGKRAAARGEETAPGLRGSSAQRPLSCLQTALGTRKTSILSLSPALTPSFFSCLTNPRIIQLRKCWKEVS